MVLILVILAAPVQAGLFEDLQQDYIDNINDMPYSSGRPAIEWQQNGNIRAWLDIVGFRNLSRDGEKYFILGDPASLAIVQYDVVGQPPGYIESIKKTVSLSQSDNNLIAVLNVKLIWFVVNCDKNSCWRSYFSEKSVFQDIEAIPGQYHINQNFSINETQYINGISNKTIIKINGSNLLKYTLTAGNSSITRRLKIGHIEYTNKGLPYMNLTRFETWNTTGGGISHQDEDIVLSGINVSYSLNASTPFNSYLPGLKKSITTHELKETVNSFTFLLLFLFGVMFGSVYFMGRRILW
jgi:hypothetical protein